MESVFVVGENKLGIQVHSQIKNLRPYWPKKAEWFVIGGPARENEAQAVAASYPKVKCIGFEPNRNLLAIQKSGKDIFYTDQPFPGPILPFALWNNDVDLLTLSIPQAGIDPARGSVCRPIEAPDMWGPGVTLEQYQVQARTLDSLSEEYGPFNNVVLWLDIEYAELAALQGATKLLERTILINIEAHEDIHLPAIDQLLSQFGFVQTHVWNLTDNPKDAKDFVYIKG